MTGGRWNARLIVLAILAALLATVLVPAASYAGSTGTRNTAIGLTGAAAYLLIKGKTVPGAIAAAGAAVAWNRYNNQREDEKLRERYWNNRYGYGDRYRFDDRYRYNDWNRDRVRDRDDRWDRDRDRDRNDRWDRNRGHDNGRHLGWERGKRVGQDRHWDKRGRR